MFRIILICCLLNSIESIKLKKCTSDRSSCKFVSSYPGIALVPTDLKHLKKGYFSNNDTDAETVLGQDGQLRQMDPGIFDGMKNIKRIFFGSNYLKHVPYGVFNNLQPDYLDIGLNFIEFIDTEAFAGMSNLRTIRLYSNQLTYFDSTWFSASGEKNNIETMSLDHNKIRSVNRNAFHIFPKLKHLLLQINELEFIAEDAFANLRLETLDLSRNRIKELNPNAFGDSLTVQNLFIARNSLSFLDKKVITNNYIKNIGLESNPWSCNCLEELRIVLHNNSVKTVNYDTNYLNQNENMPVCAVTGESCEKFRNDENYAEEPYVTLVKKVQESYKKFDNSFGCGASCVKCRTNQCWIIDEFYYV